MRSTARVPTTRTREIYLDGAEHIVHADVSVVVRLEDVAVRAAARLAHRHGEEESSQRLIGQVVIRISAPHHHYIVVFPHFALQLGTIGLAASGARGAG